MPSESVILLMSSRPRRLELLFANDMFDIANITEVKIKAIVAFPSNSNYWHFLTSSTLYKFTDILSRFYNQLNLVCLRVVASDFDSFLITSKKAILAHTIMLTVSTNKKSSNNRAHETIDTFSITMCCKAITQLWNLIAAKVMTFAQSFV